MSSVRIERVGKTKDCPTTASVVAFHISEPCHRSAQILILTWQCAITGIPKHTSFSKSQHSSPIVASIQDISPRQLLAAVLVTGNRVQVCQFLLLGSSKGRGKRQDFVGDSGRRVTRNSNFLCRSSMSDKVSNLTGKSEVSTQVALTELRWLP